MCFGLSERDPGLEVDHVLTAKDVLRTAGRNKWAVCSLADSPSTGRGDGFFLIWIYVHTPGYINRFYQVDECTYILHIRIHDTYVAKSMPDKLSFQSLHYVPTLSMYPIPKYYDERTL